MSEDNHAENLVSLTADIVAAYVSNNTVAVHEIAHIVTSIHSAISSLGTASSVLVQAELVPAVSIRSSIKPDSITCLECGKKFKMLKRHLTSDHNLKTEQYRDRWKLSSTYPLVAPNYADMRRDLAVTIQLGKPKAKN